MKYSRGSASHHPKYKSYRINADVTAPEVRVVGAEGDSVGVMAINRALEEAQRQGLDLVEIVSDVEPPVCKIVDYHKFVFSLKRKQEQKKKTQKTSKLKEIRMRPSIDVGDFDVKVRMMRGFISRGDRIKVLIRFRGRENLFKNLGRDLLERVQEELSDVSKVDQPIKAEGGQMYMVLVALKTGA